MGDPNQIQWVLENLTLLVLAGLMVFQYSHYVIASWRYWSENDRRLMWTLLVAVGWVVFGYLTVGTIPGFPYVAGLPFTLTALYGPSILALFFLAFSRRFRDFVDSLSLHWLIVGFAGPARMIVGILFLFWYFAGRLPAVVAWVAGPGDWISGFITYFAVRRLSPFAKAAGIERKHWSARDYLRANPVLEMHGRQWSTARRGLLVAICFVAFGILDFLAAPGSTTIAIAMDNVPIEMGKIPLAMIPLFLVPQVLVLEVLAMRQLYVLNRALKAG